MEIKTLSTTKKVSRSKKAQTDKAQKDISETNEDKPEQNIDEMIDGSQSNDDQLEQDSEMGVGTLGIWEGKLRENEVGMIVDDEVLQMFQKKRQGFVPVELMQKVDDRSRKYRATYMN